MVSHVLGRFRGEEKELIQEAVERAADALETALKEGFEKAMNAFN
jgi:PTH1 family peptidyl-tRNA hydrolase